MSKMNELSAMLDSLISCGETLAETGRALRDFYSNTEEAAPATPTEPATPAKPEPTVEPETQTEP